VEFLMAGAAAVQVGTATFVSPTAMLSVIEGLRGFCARKALRRVGELTGMALPRPLPRAAE
jgi:dihydroorotate dehydrogenase (NAD+) catalytic subunit